MISIILGPGNHQAQLVQEANNHHHHVVVYNYFPQYSRQEFNNGVLIKTSSSAFINLIQRLIFAFGNRLGIKTKIYQQIYYSIFDWYVSRQLTEGDIIAWPQTSLNSIRKIKKHEGKVSLEYPMIHILEWQDCMRKEYQRLKIQNGYSIFPKMIEKRIVEEINLSDQIHVLSSYAQNTFIKHGTPADKLNIRSLSIHPLYDELPPAKKKQTDKIIFLYVGRLEILKGVHLLLEAFCNLDSENSELWLIGDIFEEINPFLEHFKNVNVKILGTKTIPQLAEIYAQSDILILPSVQESFGLVILEALKYHCRIIASSNTGASDLKLQFPDKIEIFRAGDLTSLTQSIDRVFEEVKEKNI